MKTKIIKCGCRKNKLHNDKGAKYQDSKYGYGKRVANKIGKDDTGYRCTVCESIND